MNGRAETPDAMKALGAQAAESARAGSVIALVGGLGAGKTHWTKGFVAGLGSSAEVTSPTFGLVHEYPGGRLPVNTNGGGLSCIHPGMYGMFITIEAVRQLRGECGERQVANARTALVHGNGGTLSSQSTAILGTEETL